jgi:hypothetical protein
LRLPFLASIVVLAVAACFLFAIALVLADKPFLLTAVLPIGTAILMPLHPLGLGDDKRPVSRWLPLDGFRPRETDAATTKQRETMVDLIRAGMRSPTERRQRLIPQEWRALI